MIGIDRRQRGHERPNCRIAICWAMLSVILLIVGYERIISGDFPDPDDALRLVQVRDLLGGQGWFDLHQYRIDPPQGSLMHWSRLVDAPLAAIIGLLTPLLGQAEAETTASIMMPLLLLGGVLFFIGRLAWRLFGVEAAGFACLIIGLLTPVVFQFQIMRIDHHGWQILAVAIALWAIAHRSMRIGGSIAGFAMGTGLMVSINLLPMAAAFGAVLALRWFRYRDDRWWLANYLQGLALSLIVLFLATRGLSDLVAHCDVIAPAHLGFFVIVAIIVGGAASAANITRPTLIATFAGAGALGLLFFGLSSPACVGSPFGGLDPLVRDYWYLNVAEGRPLWEQNLPVALPAFAQLLVALGAIGILFIRSDVWLKRWWLDYAFLLGASIVGAVFVWRSAAFAGVIAAVPLAWLASQLLERLRETQFLVSKVTAAAAVFVVLLPSAPVMLVSSRMPGAQASEPDMPERSSCNIREGSKAFARLPRGTIFAPLDIGPSILLGSNKSVVATAHHRAEAAIHDVIFAFTRSPEEAERIIETHGARYVAMCIGLTEPTLYANANPDGFAAQLIEGNVPAWLEPIDLGQDPAFKIWRVVSAPQTRRQATTKSIAAPFMQ